MYKPEAWFCVIMCYIQQTIRDEMFSQHNFYPKEISHEKHTDFHFIADCPANSIALPGYSGNPQNVPC